MLVELVHAMAGRRVAVAGDPVLDVYVYGSTDRISREAPVLIVKEESREGRLGGAANTAANLSALGARASLIGLVGDDEDGRILRSLAKERAIDDADLLTRKRGWTVTKTRILAGGLHTRKQQMLRIDREPYAALHPDDERRVREAAFSSFERIDALIVSDYGDGSLTKTWIEVAKAAAAAKKIVIVDSRYALRSYSGVTAVVPNEPEAEAALGTKLSSGEQAAEAAAKLCDELELTATLLTRGREGMAIAERGKPPLLLPAHGGREAVDVTGAGDTVAATFALALSAGASIVDAATLANCAASVVVQQVGAATCSPEELIETLGVLA
jgi:D-glycero-beta-D-manno-heptose-7-phosphate kinase